MPSDRINGAALRAIRERSDLTIDTFAALLRDAGARVNAAHISNIEAERRGASPALLAAMARVLRVPKVALLRERADDAA